MPNDDLISRAAAIRAVHEEFDECLVWDESGEATANAVESVLYWVQSVDASPVVHGWWITNDDCGELECPICGGIQIEHGMFCTWCGARMDASPTCGARMDASPTCGPDYCEIGGDEE